MKKKDIRLNELIDLLRIEKKVPVKELGQRFNVTEMTIRRDIEILQSSNIVNLIHGIVFLNESHASSDDSLDYLVIQQQSIHDDEKERIAKFAAKMVEPGDSIIVDIGTTTSKLIKFLPTNYPITLICFTVNSLVEALKKNFEKLMFSGGIYHPGNQVFESDETITFLENIRSSKVFMSAAGVCENLGITCINQNEVLLKKTSIKNAMVKILLVDSSKFKVVKNAYFADLSDFDVIVTDNGITDEWIDIIDSFKIKLYIV